MIIRKFLFQKFHHPRHDKVEDVVENTGGDERNHRGLGRRDLFCDREHFRISQRKAQGSVFYKCDNLIRDRRENPFYDLRKNDTAECKKIEENAKSICTL